MSVNGTSCLLNRGAAAGLARDTGQKSFDNLGGQADSGPQSVRAPVRGRVATGFAVLAVTVAILGVARQALGQTDHWRQTPACRSAAVHPRAGR